MDQKVRAYADRQADNKRMMDNNSKDNNAQQPSYKKQNVARAYFAGPSENKEYAETLPSYNKSKFHHNGPCTVRAYADRQADNKRMMDNNSRDNNAQQPSYKKQNVARAYFPGPSENKEYAETLPSCNKSKFHHNGLCTVMCANCKRVGHFTRDCRSPTAANIRRTLTCFECGNQGHYHSKYLKLRNQNRRNQAGSGEARERVYALGGVKADQYPINVEDEADA
nr:reverse transcriptase domain-containing protein [Tanacetum cinerariifolium]